MNEKVTEFKAARTGLARLLLAVLQPRRSSAVQVSASALRLKRRGRWIECSLGDVKSSEITTGWIWSGLRIRYAGGESLVTGLTPTNSRVFTAALEGARTDWWREMLAPRIDSVRSVCNKLAQFEDPPFYLTRSAHERLWSEAERAAEKLVGHWPRSMSSTPEIKMLKTILDFLESPDRFRKEANTMFVANELIRSRKFFDRFEKYPLTEEQRRIIVIDEDRNLIIAGAGSGKTAMIVSKVGWLLTRGFRRPSELLLLAYARDARKEMEERVHKQLYDRATKNVTVNTFHSLGLAIIGKVEGRRPSLAKATQSRQTMNNLLTEIVDELIVENKISEAVVTWFQDQFAPYRSQHDFTTRGEYYDYIRRFEIRTLKGERVKSFEECRIANFLFVNGINYVYEHPYELDTSTVTKGQYLPDFYLPDVDIWIEHFGIDAHGNTAPFVPQERYLASMAWKRNTHDTQGTVLIETFSYESADGSLLRNLEHKLRRHGVTLSPIPTSEILASLSEQGFDSFMELVATFLEHFKGAQLSRERLMQRANQLANRRRTKAFLNVFWPIFERYQEKLSQAGHIDYHDMILKATEHVEMGRYRSPFSYILVDEFQDISADRARLLKALVDSSPGVQLFAVGDDWQAIFRFSGSDISIMREFAEHFGKYEQHTMETTFRCVDRISEAANEFILRNPLQISKTIRSMHHADEPRIHLGLPEDQDDSQLEEALGRIVMDASKHEAVSSVLLLGRYNFLKPQNLSSLKRQFHKLQITFNTIHGSKGLEADYVVVLGFRSERYGFPSEITDDPLLNLVLPAPEVYPNAEERRLFYVALTRARRHVFLLVEGKVPSSFASELINDGYDITIFGQSPKHDVYCPSCNTGRIVRRVNKQSGRSFFGCSNFPYCKYKPQSCPSCKKGLLVTKDENFVCRDCDQSFEVCPDCDGVLVEKKGKYGPFLGCSNFPNCRYGRNLGRKRRRRRHSAKILKFPTRKRR